MEVLDNKLGVLANMYFPTNEGYLKEQTQVRCFFSASDAAASSAAARCVV
jgi:hypothetical protein